MNSKKEIDELDPSDEQFPEAEQLARRALDQDKDDPVARRLWKLSRRAQGKTLNSDLPVTLRKEIYAEHGLAVERHLFLVQNISGLLQQAENPHQRLAAAIDNASTQARNFILSKYSLTSFELDLILHEGQKESWPLKSDR